jgi:hypothetical protein
MNYIGLDIHKKYSVACVQDERGQIVRRERIEATVSKVFDAVCRENGRG